MTQPTMNMPLSVQNKENDGTSMAQPPFPLHEPAWRVLVAHARLYAEGGIRERLADGAAHSSLEFAIPGMLMEAHVLCPVSPHDGVAGGCCRPSGTGGAATRHGIFDTHSP